MSDLGVPTDNGRKPKVPRAEMPRWVKVFLITAAALLLLLVAVMLISGSDHGPWRHVSSAGADRGALQQDHVLSVLRAPHVGVGSW
jgi:hypothetical protein